MVRKKPIHEELAEAYRAKRSLPPEVSWRPLGRGLSKSNIMTTLNPCSELSMYEQRRQGLIESIRGSKASKVWIDSWPHSLSPAEEKQPLPDATELFKSVGRSLKGETQEASPFRARVRSEKQLDELQRNLRNHNEDLVEHNAELNRCIFNAREERDHARANTAMLRQSLDKRDELIHNLRAKIEKLEAVKLPDKGSW